MTNLKMISLLLLLSAMVPANEANLDILKTITSLTDIFSGKQTPAGGSRGTRTSRQKIDHDNYLRALLADEASKYNIYHLEEFMKLPEPAQELCFRVALAYLKADNRELTIIEPYMPYLIRRILIDWMDLFYRQPEASAEALMNLVEELPADGVIRKQMWEGLGWGRKVFKWYDQLGPYKQMLKAALAVSGFIG